MQKTEHVSAVFKAFGPCLHVLQSIGLQSTIFGMKFQDVDKLVVTRGRVSDGMDHWKREFPLRQVLAKAFGGFHLPVDVSID